MLRQAASGHQQQSTEDLMNNPAAAAGVYGYTRSDDFVAEFFNPIKSSPAFIIKGKMQFWYLNRHSRSSVIQYEAGGNRL
jgi:hypothetical protein